MQQRGVRNQGVGVRKDMGNRHARRAAAKKMAAWRKKMLAAAKQSQPRQKETSDAQEGKR